MINGHDEETLSRMLGTGKYSDELVAEYEIRIRMLHASGGGTGLGPVGLIDLCRFVGVSRGVAPQPVAEVTDWRFAKSGDEVMVKTDADPVGSYRVGVFRDVVAPGIIGVQFEGREWVEGIPARFVRPGKAADLIAEKIASPEYQRTLLDPASDVTSVEMEMNTDADCHPTFKWSEVVEGVSVVVGDDMIDGEFVSLAKPKGCLVVSMGGTKHVVEAGDVVLKE